MVLVDYYSRYVVAEFVKSTDILSTTSFLRKIFASYGAPSKIRSDNGPPFNGIDWLHFCSKFGVEPEFSAPVFPQQNGLVKRYMQLINKAITIALVTAGNVEQGLAETIASHNCAIQILFVV